MDLRIPGAAFAGLTEGEWTRVEIRYGGSREVLVNGVPAVGAALNFRAGEIGGDSEVPGTMYAAFFLVPGPSLPPGQSLPDGTFSIDEILLEESVPSYRANLGTALEWSRPGVMAEFKSKPVLEDLTVKTALESGARGNPFPDSGEAENFLGAASRSAAAITFLGVRLEGNLALRGSGGSDGENFAWDAGHGISRAWGPFSAKEQFSISPLDDFMDHAFALRFSSRFSASLESNLRYEEEKLQRRWTGSLGLKQGPKLPLEIFLDADARWTEAGEIRANYAEAWAHSWKSMIPDLGGGAEKRDAHGRFETHITTLPVGAELNLDALSEAAKKSGLTRSTAQERIGIPFAIADWKLLFSMERIFSRNLFYYGGDIQDDLTTYAEALGGSLPLMFSVPFYSLFADNQGGNMAAAMTKFSSADLIRDGSFTDRAALNINFPVQYGLPSLFLPRSFDAEIKRVLERKLDTQADTFYLGSGLGFSALNIFGAFGAVPLFKFYQTDEFSHGIRGGIGIPREGDLSWQIQDEQRWSFYGFGGAELSLENTFTANSLKPVDFLYLETSGYRLLESLILGWTVPSKNSLLGVLYIWFCNKVQNNENWPALVRLAESEYERLRRETLEVVFDRQGDVLKTTFILGHESIIRIMGRLNLSAFAKLNCAQNYDTRIFSFIATVGTSLTVHF
jgi:hypothetical protein